MPPLAVERLAAGGGDGGSDPRCHATAVVPVDWDAEECVRAVRLRAFGDEEAIGVVDETGFIKKGTHSAG